MEEIVENKQEVIVESPYEIELSNTYDFEGKNIVDLDLKGLNDLTAGDMLKLNKQLERGGNTSLMPEISMEYALHMAAIATKLPVEFFLTLKPRDAVKVKNKVTSFLYG